MKRIILALSVLVMVLCLSACGDSTSKVRSDISGQMDAIRAGKEDLIIFDLYDRMNIKDSKLSLAEVENTKMNGIFSGMEYSVKDVTVNSSTAIATLEIKAKNIDKILSRDYVFTQLVLDYAKFIQENQDTDRMAADSEMLNKIALIIGDDNAYSVNTVNVNVYYSQDKDRWVAAYDDELLDALLGKSETKGYSIDFDDICEEASKNVDIKYDYNKIINLPSSNKTTRSSIKNPIKLGQEAYFDNSDFFFQKERYELKMKVTEIIRGEEAKALVNSEEILDVNEEYILFKLNIKLENNLSEKDILIDSTDFSLLDSKGHYYNNCMIFTNQQLQPIKEGESTEGWICFTITKGRTPFLLFKDYMDNTLCFSE